MAAVPIMPAFTSSKDGAMFRNLAAALAFATLAMAGAAQGAQGDWLGRVRVININPDASSSALSLDIKKVWIDADVKAAATGATAVNLKINPVIIGAGLGMKF
jgi:outer membrane protein W